MKEITKKNWLMMIGGIILAGLFLWLGLYALKELPINISTKVKPGIYLKIEASLDNSAWHTILQNRGTETLGNVHRTIYDGNNLYLSGDIFNNITACEPLYIRITNLTAKSDVTGNLATAGPALNAYFSDKNGVASYPSYGVENINFAASTEAVGGSKTFVVVPNTVMLNNQFTFYLHVSLTDYVSTEYNVTQNLNSVVTSSNNFAGVKAVAGKNFETTLTANNTGVAVSITSITVGGVEIFETASGYDFDSETGKLTIYATAINGAIVINANTKPYEVSVYLNDDSVNGVVLEYKNNLFSDENSFKIDSGKNFVAKLQINDDISSLWLTSNDEYISNYTYNKRTSLLTIPATAITGDLDINLESYWDGSIATRFAGGAGTAANPYKIATGGQLALLANIINTANGSTVSGYSTSSCRTAYYEMTNNIYLNDEQFSGDVENGYIQVTDGTNTSYLGSGVGGTTMGAFGNVAGTTFTSLATQPVAITRTTTQSASVNYGTNGKINIWEPIGHYRGESDVRAIYGIINGNNYLINGLYENQSLINMSGLFGYSYNIIKNVFIDSSFVRGKHYVSALIANPSTTRSGNMCCVYNCGVLSNVFLLSSLSGCVGGLVGELYNYTQIKNSYSLAQVVGSGDGVGGNVGRIAGPGTCEIINNYNIGKVKNISVVGNSNCILGLNINDTVLTNNFYLGEILYNTSTSGTPTINSCGSINRDTQVLTAYPLNTGESLWTAGTTLIDALNIWVNAQQNPEYCTWVTDAETGYPTFGDFWSAS